MKSFMSEFSFKTILLDDQPTFHHNNQIAESQIDHIIYLIPDSCKDIHLKFAEHLCLKDNSANLSSHNVIVGQTSLPYKSNDKTKQTIH